MTNIRNRVVALEQAQPSAMPRWHCLRRYENETDEEAIASYEADHGPIGGGNIVMRIIIAKPGSRPTPAAPL